MKLAVTIRRIAAVTLALAMSATWALAAHRDMDGARGAMRTHVPPRSARWTAHALSPVQAAVADMPRTATGGGAVSCVVAHSASAPGAPARHPDKHEHARSIPGRAPSTHRPAHGRGKGQGRATAATPGVGLLLHIGPSADQELSLTLDLGAQAPYDHFSGRAPPERGPTSSIAQAAPPRVAVLAIPSRARRSTPFAGALSHPTFERCTSRACLACPAGLRRAPRGALAHPAPLALEEPCHGSRAAREKGAAVRNASPFTGGCTA